MLGTEQRTNKVTVRVKDTCPLANSSGRYLQEAWDALRGKPIILLRPIPEAEVEADDRCGSEYWQIALTDAVQQAKSLSDYRASDPNFCICRHCLEIGD